MKKVFFVLSLLLLASLCYADIPKKISIQGRLSDSSDIPVSGSYRLRFRFYDSYTGGNLLDTVIVDNVNVDNGLFSVEISPSLSFDEAYYVEVSVWNNSQWNVLSPRVNLTSVAYSYSASKLLPTSSDVVASRFVDYDDNSYYCDPSGMSELSEINVTGDAYIGNDLYLSGSYGTGKGEIHDVFRVLSPSDEDLWIGLTGNNRVVGFYDYVNGMSIFEYNESRGEVDFHKDLDMNGNQICLDYCRNTWPSGVGGSGTDNYIPRWNSAANLENSVIYQTDDGKIGIRTTSPEFRLTLDKNAATPDGGILAIGTTDSGATLTIAGAGTRLIWYPRKAAFRAGEVNFDQWDDTNIGWTSVAMGYNTKASGSSAVALGQGTTASGTSSTALGGYSTASGIASTAIGNGAQATGSYSVALGGNNPRATNYGAIAIGNDVTASGQFAYVIGKGAGSGSNALINDIQDSLMIGFNSNIPTLFIGPSSGLETTGNVGIGTASPKSKLDVSGDITLSGTARKIYFGVAGENGPHGLNFSNELFVFYRTSPNNLEFEHSDGTDILVIDRDGKRVGIGTNTPDPYVGLDIRNSEPLGNRGQIIADTYLLRNKTGLAYVPSDTGGWIDVYEDNLNLNLMHAISGKGISFNIPGGVGGVTRMFIRSDGNVGIGTTSPQSPLHVEKDIDNWGRIARFYDPSMAVDDNMVIHLGKSDGGPAAEIGFTYKGDTSDQNILFLGHYNNPYIVKIRKDGNVYVEGNIYKTGTISFVQDYPDQPGKQIVYVALEGPEAATYIRGTAECKGVATIQFPEHFKLVTSKEGLTAQLTPRGKPNNLFIINLSNEKLVVGCSEEGTFDYFVQGTRVGYEDFNPIKTK